MDHFRIYIQIQSRELLTPAVSQEASELRSDPRRRQEVGGRRLQHLRVNDFTIGRGVLGRDGFDVVGKLRGGAWGRVAEGQLEFLALVQEPDRETGVCALRGRHGVQLELDERGVRRPLPVADVERFEERHHCKTTGDKVFSSARISKAQPNEKLSWCDNWITQISCWIDLWRK